MSEVHNQAVNRQELNDWVASIWPTPQTDRQLADQLIRLSSPFVVRPVLRRYRQPELDEVLARACQMGIWVGMRTFDPERGIWTAHAYQYARTECQHVMLEKTLPMVQPYSTRSRKSNSMLFPHIAGWRRRHRTDPQSRSLDYVGRNGMSLYDSIESSDLQPDLLFTQEEDRSVLERYLRFMRVDYRDLWRQMLDGEITKADIARLRHVSRQRVADLEQQWRLLCQASTAEQLRWVESKAADARRRQGPQWQAIADDYSTLVAEMRTTGVTPALIARQPIDASTTTQVCQMVDAGNSRAVIARQLGLSRHQLSRVLDRPTKIAQ